MASSAERLVDLVANCSDLSTTRLEIASALRAGVKRANMEAAKRFWSVVTMSMAVLYSCDMAAPSEAFFIVGVGVMVLFGIFCSVI